MTTTATPLQKVSIARFKDASEVATGDTLKPGQFKVTRTGTAAEIDSVLSLGIKLDAGTGTDVVATEGTDYQISSKNITFEKGETVKYIDITPIPNGKFQGTEKVIATLATPATDAKYSIDTIAANNSATLSINDLETAPLISIVASDSTASEASIAANAPAGTNRTGEFTFTRTGTNTEIAGQLDVSYTLATGSTAANTSDFEISVITPDGVTNPGTYSFDGANTLKVTFAAGSAQTKLLITPKADHSYEGTEQVTFKLAEKPLYKADSLNGSATVNITDEQTVKPGVAISTPFSATDSIAELGETAKIFTIKRTGTNNGVDPAAGFGTKTNDRTDDLTVKYTLDGSATNVADYKIESTNSNVTIDQKNSTITFKNGAETADIKVTAVSDNIFEKTETAKFTLVNDEKGSYSVDAAKTTTSIKILDDASGKNLFSDKFVVSTMGDASSTTNDSIGLFYADDAEGTVGNVSVDDAGYANAVLARSQEIATILAGKALDDNGKAFSAGESNRTVNLSGLAGNPEFARLYRIADGTKEQFQQDITDGKDPKNISFKALGTSNINISATDGSRSVTFDNLTLKIADSNPDITIAPEKIGTKNQAEGNEGFDLSNVTGDLVMKVQTLASAWYQDKVGFYEVKADGSLKDGTVISDTDNYIKGALAEAMTNAMGFSTTDQTTTLSGNHIYRAVLMVDEADGKGNLTGIHHDYFADKNLNEKGLDGKGVDHVHLLGDNKFGFEDIFGGSGDRDFNDIIFKADFAVKPA